MSCGQRVFICSGCDRGQRYCAGACSSNARERSVRAAKARYARSPRGKRNNAHRQKRWRLSRTRAQERFAVTDQSSPLGSSLREVRSVPSPKEEFHDCPISKRDSTSSIPAYFLPSAQTEEHECAFCHCVRTYFVRLDWLPRSPYRGPALRRRQ